ncbi:amidase family protein [Pseudomonas lijiangensis]|uniref:amidase n=1 Tax=Pseudomonas syringae group TaxID=136849 RepID=UPI0019102370|nr:amidase family protein [Pseudomonas cichorii]GFM65372.1 amidase [Pseudomonas cichorii]
MPDSDLLSQSATKLRALIGNKQLSPVELLDACIQRIETLNPKINAFSATCFERARQEAKEAEQAVMQGKPLGLLHGLPIGIKDLEETADVLTTYGSQLFRDNVPSRDNLFVARLRGAGAVMVGKTNVPEMGAGANTRNVVWGATGNPFDPNLNAGGSSGGSAAALAVDMVPLCSGSDTGGSLRIPAALCGIVGLRPSPGLVPSERKKLGWTPISVVGPMGRTVADTLLQLRASAGLGQSDPLSYAVSSDEFAPRSIDLSQLRVGYSEDFGSCAVDDNIRAVFRAKIDALKPLFKSCEAIDLNLESAHHTFDVLRAEAFVAGLQDAHDRDPDALGPNTRANYEMGAAMSLQDCVKAHGEQSRIFRSFQRQFERYDLILAPTTPVSPFPWTELYLREVNGVPLDNYYRWLALCYTITLTTNPAVSVPCGLDHKGMPFGLQVIGGFREDATLMACAQALEEATTGDPRLSRPRPDLQKLMASAVDLTHIVTHPPIYGGSGTRKPDIGAM